MLSLQIYFSLRLGADLLKMFISMRLNCLFSLFFDDIIMNDCYLKKKKFT